MFEYLMNHCTESKRLDVSHSFRESDGQLALFVIVDVTGWKCSETNLATSPR